MRQHKTIKDVGLLCSKFSCLKECIQHAFSKLTNYNPYLLRDLYLQLIICFYYFSFLILGFFTSLRHEVESILSTISKSLSLY